MVLCLLPVLPPELRPFAEEHWPVFNPWLLLDIWDLIRWLWKGILLPPRQWDIVANLLARSGKDYEENTGADLSTYRRRSILPLCRVVVLFSSASLVCFCSYIWGVGMLSHNILVAGFGFVLPFGFPNLSFSVFFLFFKMGIFLVWLFNINRC
ncbi:hypothetical protein Goari_016545 [Gossypium aridum]|uniref:Uncharacterized protein n=1 Tax=Gossypium aridum TaxID=34290 RepID=A0A7J8WIW1_GOSAI|nr:hypothetical protein [Gossypium aridum]